MNDLISQGVIVEGRLGGGEDCKGTLGLRCADIFKANITGADIFPI